VTRRRPFLWQVDLYQVIYEVTECSVIHVSHIFCNINFYLITIFSLIGHLNPTVNCHQPGIEVFTTEENRANVEQLISTLFIAAVPEMGLTGKLWPLSKCVFATILMYLPETRSRYPENHALKELIFKASKVVSLPNFPSGITTKHMLKWGSLVTKKFHEDNKISSIDPGTLMSVTSETVKALEKQIVDQEISHKIEISRITDTLNAISSGMLALLGQDPQTKQQSIDRLLEVSALNGTHAVEVHEPNQVKENVERDELIKENSVVEAQSNFLQPLVLPAEFLKPPINDSGHQSDKINLTESHTFLNDFYTKNLGSYGGNTAAGGLGTVKLNESEWSRTKVSNDNKGLCKDLIILAENIASKEELITLKSASGTVNLSELSDQTGLTAEICRSIVVKIKKFLVLKEDRPGKTRLTSGSVGAIVARWKKLYRVRPSEKEKEEMSIVDLSVNLKSKTKRKFFLITSVASSDCQDNANTTSSSSSGSSSGSSSSSNGSSSNGSSSNGSSSNGSSSNGSSSESRSDVVSTVAII
jgi:uncharacterized membrane protein YgcG